MRSLILIPITFVVVMVFAILAYDPKQSSSPDVMDYETMIASKKQDCVNEGGQVVYFHYYSKVHGGYQKQESFVCRMPNE